MMGGEAGDALLRSLESMKARQNAVQAILDRAVARDRSAIAEAFKTTRSTQRLSTVMITVTVLLFVAVLVLVSLHVAYLVAQSIKLAVNAVQGVAAGDLTTDFRVESTDETGDLLTAMKVTAETLATIIGKVRNGASTLASAATQLVASAMELSQSTSQQAAAVEETTSQPRGDERLHHPERREQRPDGTDGGEGRERRRGERRRRSSETVDGDDDASPRRSPSSRRSPTRPTSSRSTPPSKRRAPASTAAASRSSPPRCASSPSAARPRRKTSASSPRPASASRERSGALLAELVPTIRKTADLVQEVAAASNEQAARRDADQPRHDAGRSGHAAQRLGVRGALQHRRGDGSQAETLQETISFFTVDDGQDTPRAPAAPAAPRRKPAAAPPPHVATYASALQPPLPVGDAADYKRF